MDNSVEFRLSSGTILKKKDGVWYRDGKPVNALLSKILINAEYSTNFAPEKFLFTSEASIRKD